MVILRKQRYSESICGSGSKTFAGQHRDASPRDLERDYIKQQTKKDRLVFYCAWELLSERADAGLPEQIRHLVAGIEHARLHGRGRNPDDLRHLIHRLLVVVHEIDDFAVSR